MDPGNWATDIAGGSKYNYTLLSVILISNFLAILLQNLSLKLGIATGRDLAQACRDNYSRPAVYAHWVLCEIAIDACDLAEVIGSAIALNLLFHIPMIYGVCITALDVLLVLFFAEQGVPIYRGAGDHAHPHHRRLFCVGDFCVASGFCGHSGGIRADYTAIPRSRHALYRHRHPGGDSHAA